MCAVIAKLSKSKLFLLATTTAILLCLTLVNIVRTWTSHRWSSSSLPQTLLVQKVNEIVVMDKNIQNEQELEYLWEKEYQSRVQRVRDVCKQDNAAAQSGTWKAASNRIYGKLMPCRTSVCPIIVDEEREFMFCFVPKVASTQVKKYILNISDITLDISENDREKLHVLANQELNRVGVMYYNSTILNRFLKIIFVRHPFERLVSAFIDKTKKCSSNKHFYINYWDPLMKKLRSKDATLYMPSFEEFVWYIIDSSNHLLELDEHWTPFWSRCNPCHVDYDFIGKLETAKQDFSYVFRKLGIETSSDWWESAGPTQRSITISYFSTVSDEDIQKLYEIYKLDFDLFGYSLDEFFPPNSVRN